MGYKLIVSDMDETLLNDNREISENNLRMIKLAKEKYGIKLADFIREMINTIILKKPVKSRIFEDFKG